MGSVRGAGWSGIWGGTRIAATPVYDTGSPRLQQSHAPAAAFRPGGMFPDRPASMAAAVGQAVRALFAN